MMYAIHGFLGLPSDWNFLISDSASYQVKAIDPFHICSPSQGLAEWGKRFNEMHSQNCSILLGYSLGARLAMHALIQNPAAYQAAILISGHPGLDHETSKIKRRESDAVWAQRFLTEDWEPLLHAWNKQPVFRGSLPLTRPEQLFCRKQLSSALEGWSLSGQRCLTEFLEKLDIPIFWIVGAADSPQVTRVKALKLKHPLSRTWIAPHAGHRVPWDIPRVFLQEVKHFMN
jgi:2-succinyl-6-hydroxy-2,4-cyclohexadiene-1-carboxylate synthase